LFDDVLSCLDQVSFLFPFFLFRFSFPFLFHYSPFFRISLLFNLFFFFFFRFLSRKAPLNNQWKLSNVQPSCMFSKTFQRALLHQSLPQ
jgi:hypothetical protein